MTTTDWLLALLILIVGLGFWTVGNQLTQLTNIVHRIRLQDHNRDF